MKSKLQSPTPGVEDLASRVMQRVEILARISDEPDRLTRTYASLAMRRVNDLVADWMREAGMSAREDAIGNLIGRYPCAKPEARTLLLGSHLDTVRNAGKFDGALGVLMAIACVERLNAMQERLPFHLEVIGFADEEGVRYSSPFLGSRVLAGTFDQEHLSRSDGHDITMTEAIRRFGGAPDSLAAARRDPQGLLGYLEAHIEQGPVLEKTGHAVGVVTGIAGQLRARFLFTGRSGHAGTTPMKLRQDALCAAAEFILAVEADAREHEPLVATVGQIIVNSQASNVIPGSAWLSLDLRHPSDEGLKSAWERLTAFAGRIAAARGATVAWEELLELSPVTFSGPLSPALKTAAQRQQKEVPELFSGAGHDAAVLAGITPVAMLFVRCKGGISHHPDESVEVDDVRLALAVMNDFLQELARPHHGES